MLTATSLASPKRWREPILLTLILLLATGLRLWRLDQNGYSNLHYAATIRSMLVSWHNFFFVAFDPLGFLSVDKPPIAFWIQAATAWLLGFSGFSLLLPQALEGVIAVGLIYHLVRRRFAMEAALLAGLVLAITPTSVAVDRSNCPDSCLVLVLLLASWAVVLAAERSDWRFLLLSAALVGVAFNTKMLVAYGVLPVFTLVYLLGTKLRPSARLRHLAGAFLVVATVSASWGLVVDSTPADNRPYVGSSHNNSVLGLIFGHNGLERLFGVPSGSPSLPAARHREEMPGFGGAPGPYRLAGPEMAGQIAWLFPMAAAGSVAIAFGAGLRRPPEPNGLALLLWGGWLASYAVAFSFARGIVHPYYLVLLAAPLAALVGIGVSTLWTISRRGGWGLAALPTALIVTALWQARLLAAYPGWPAQLPPFLVGGVFGLVLGLVGALLLKSRSAAAILAERAMLCLSLSAVLVAPLVWALTPVLAEGNPVIPVADPALLTGVGGLAPEVVDPADVRPLVEFLRAHNQGERCLLATSHLMVAALIIVETGEPVISTAGFMGTEAVLTPAKFARMVTERQVRYALLTPVFSPGRANGSTSDRAPGGARIVSPAIWRPNNPGANIPVQAGDHPSEAADPAAGADASPGPINRLRIDLRRLELYDFRHDSPNESSDLKRKK
jgi:4-amino-4-deoxy-L-arabinose transferase-like glycosyltransferase